MRIPRAAARSANRPRRTHALAAALAATLLAAVPAVADGDPGGRADGVRPTVVLIHGAFADASSWSGVVTRLQREGYTVVAPANPLRGLPQDSTYIASVLKSIKGPIVLAGHSYGGEVITQAAAGDPQVKALVYINAIMPDVGESSNSLSARFPVTQVTSAVKQVPYRNADGSTGVDLYLKPDKLHALFAADVTTRQAAVLAATQRPIVASAFDDKATAAAWHTIPTWVLVGAQDRTINPALELFEGRRAHAHIVEINSSHVSLISHPGAVADLILDAAHATQRGNGR